MPLEEQRWLQEDLERLEQGIADRMSDEPKLVSGIRLGVRPSNPRPWLTIHPWTD